MQHVFLRWESFGELTEVPSEELEPHEYVGLGGSCFRVSRTAVKSKTPEEENAGADIGGTL